MKLQDYLLSNLVISGICGNPFVGNPETAERLATHYKVSKNTIKRDERLADAIDAIGKKSPEAKRKILAGEANIPKKHLKELTTADGYDVARLATKLEEDTYNWRKAAAQEPAS